MSFMFDFIKRKMSQARQAREQEQLALLEAQERERQRVVEYHQMQRNILAILDDGKLPDIDWEASVGRLPFKFMRSEHLIFVFPSVTYLEQRTKREIVGRSAGTSVRVAKGVSVRVGQSRGTPVERDEVVDRGLGTMAVTTKHLYFNGERSFRVNFGKIVSVESMGSDTVSITRDRASAQPEFFVVGSLDAQFAYELLQAIPSLEFGSGDLEVESPGQFHLLTYDGGGYGFDD